jgi:hypothetical protein
LLLPIGNAPGTRQGSLLSDEGSQVKELNYCMWDLPSDLRFAFVLAMARGGFVGVEEMW